MYVYRRFVVEGMIPHQPKTRATCARSLAARPWKVIKLVNFSSAMQIHAAFPHLSWIFCLPSLKLT